MDTATDKTEFELFDAAFSEATSESPAADVEMPAAEPVKEPPATAAEAASAAESATPTPETITPAPEATVTPPAVPTTAAEAATAAEASVTPPAAAETTKAEPAAPNDYQKQTVDLLEKLVQKGTSPDDSSAASVKASGITRDQDLPSDPEPFKLSAEQVTLLETFDKEWPEVSSAVALRTQTAIGQAVGALVQQLRTELTPVLAHYAQTAGSMHFGAIKTAHEDFDTLKPQLLTWIDKQPTGLRAAYQEIARNGAAEDVIELVNLYKKASGIGVMPKEPSSDTRVTVVKTPTPEVQRAAASLTVVPGKRAVIPKGAVDPDDFDGAWQEANSR